MMKKMFATMLALSMCLSLAACGPKGSASTSGSSAGTSGSSASGSQAAASAPPQAAASRSRAARGLPAFTARTG